MRKSLIPLLFTLMLLLVPARQAAAQNVIVIDKFGVTALQSSCAQVGCNILYGLDGSVGKTFLVSPTSLLSLTNFLFQLLLQPGITDAEVDLNLQLTGSLTAPSGLWDNTPVTYYGSTVWDGYVHQPASYIIELPNEQSQYPGVTGSGIVAVIDTGIDPTHPVFNGVLVPGYDFTRNCQGGSELSDVNQSTMSVVDGSAAPFQVNQSTMAVVDSNEGNTLDTSQYAAFGHGTMTSGIIHLVAPTAQIMPLKAFRADGSAYLSDILRAIYYATQNGANVINMSFDLPNYSQALYQALATANNAGIIAVASAGNDGEDILVYPAANTNFVMGVASTDDQDQQSSFTNYGDNLVWVAAPGEAIISAYPGGTYAAGWGTSFSAPFVSGEAALIRSVVPNASQSFASKAIAQGKYINSNLNNGRIDVYLGISSVE